MRLLIKGLIVLLLPAQLQKAVQPGRQDPKAALGFTHASAIRRAGINHIVPALLA